MEEDTHEAVRQGSPRAKRQCKAADGSVQVVPAVAESWDDVHDSCCTICAQRFFRDRMPYTVCAQGHVTCLPCHEKV